MILAGDHVPVTPLGDVFWSIGAVDPEQISGIGAKLGAVVEVQSAVHVMVLVLDPHNPTHVSVNATDWPDVKPVTLKFDGE